MILRNFVLQIFSSKIDRNPRIEQASLSNDSQRAALAIIDTKEKEIDDLRLDPTGGQAKHFEQALRAIKTIFEVMTKGSSRGAEEITEEEKEEIETLLRDLIDAQLDARVVATVTASDPISPTRVLKAAEYHDMYLEETAQAHRMTEAQLIQFNIDNNNSNFHVNGKEGKRWCLKEDTVLVPQDPTEAAAKQAELEEAQRELISSSGAARLEDVLTERDRQLRARAQEQLVTIQAKHSELHESVIGNYRANLQGKVVDLPKFLRGNFKKTGHDEWAELLRRAEQGDNPETKRLVLLIDDEPLSWRPSQLRSAVREGGNKKLSFDDITKHKLGEKESQFFSKYEAAKGELAAVKPQAEEEEAKINTQLGVIGYIEAELQTQLKDHPELHKERNESYEEWRSRISSAKAIEGPKKSAVISTISRLETANEKLDQILEKSLALTKAHDLEEDIAFRESLMVQAFQILQAMREIAEGSELEQNAFRRFNEEITTSEAVQNKTAIYDIDDLLIGTTVVVEEGHEGLGTTTEVVAQVRQGFDTMGVKDKHLKHMDEAFVLKLMVSTCGIDNLVRTGSIVKDTETGSLYLKQLPDNFAETNLTAVAESFKMHEIDRGDDWILTFDLEEAGAFKLAWLSKDQTSEGKEAYTRALAAKVFQNQGDTLTMEDIAAGEKAIYKKTAKHMLASVGDAESALEDLLTHRREFDPATGEETINEEELMEDMRYFLNTGIDNFFQDTEIDIVEVLKELGIDLPKETAKQVKKLDKAINKRTRQAARKRMQIDNKLTRQKNQGWSADRAREIEDLEREISHLRTKNEADIATRMSIFTSGNPSYIDQLKTKLALTDDISEISDWQKIFIHNGYAISEGRRMDERIDATNAEQVEALLEQYGNDPLVGPMLHTIVKSKPDIRVDQLQACVDAVYVGLRRGAEIQAQLAEAETGGSRYIFGVGGMLETMEGEGITGGRAGLYIPIQLPIEGLSMSVGIGGGFTEESGFEAEAGAGVAYNLQVDPNFHMTTSLHIGAGFKGAQTYVGATITETFTVTSGVWDFSVSPTGGFKLSLQDGIVLGGAVTVGAGVNMDRYRERQIDKAKFRTCTDILEATDLTNAQKVDAIAKVPGFKEISDQLAQVSPTVREQILIEMFTQYANHVGNVAITELTPPPITGFSVTLMPYPPFIVPMVSFAFAGRAKLYFATPGDPNELYTDSNKSLQQELAAELSKREGQKVRITDTGLLDRTSILMTQMGPSDQPYMTGRQKFPVSMRDILAGNLEARNDELNQIGINLSAADGGERGLLNLDVNGIRGNVDIRLDPSMEAYLVVGSQKPPTSRDLYLALNQMAIGSNLVITREEFITRHKDGGEYKYTRLTIRAVDPAQAERSRQRNYFSDYEELGGPMISFRNDSNLDIDSTDQDNLLIWDEYLARKDELAATGLTTLSLDEYEADLQRLYVEIFDDSRETIRVNDLEAPAIKFFEANKELCSQATLFDKDMGADLSALEAKIRTDLAAASPPITNISELEMAYVLTVIRKQTYAHPKSPRTPEQKAAYREYNKQYFSRILSEHYSPELAAKFLSDIERNKGQAPKKVPATAEIFTVVGHNGAEGLRADTMQNVELLNATDYSNNPAMRMEVLTRLRAMPENDAEFMRTSIATNTLELYYLLKSPEKAVKMQAIYKNPALLERPAYKAIFAEFKTLALQLRAAEITGDKIVIRTDYGVEFVAQMSPEIWGGSLGYCDNPTMVVNERIRLGIPEGTTLAGLRTSIQELPGTVQKEIYQFFAAGAVTREDQPTTVRRGQPEEAIKEEEGGEVDYQLAPEKFDRDIGLFEGGGEEAPGEGSGIFQ